MSAHVIATDAAAAILPGAIVPAGQTGTLAHFEVVAADPRVAGLAREIGSTAVLLSGGTVGALYTKVGAGTRQWRLEQWPLALEDLWRVRAQFLCGFTAPRFLFREFQEDLGDIGDNAGTGSQAYVDGTIAEAASGATAASRGARILTYAIGGLTGPSTVPGGSSGVWYLATRFKLTTAVDAQAALRLAMRVGLTTNSWGFNGSISDTKYSARFDNGPALVSTVSVDTAWHVLESWRVGGLTYLSVDGETPVSSNSYPSASGQMTIYAENGTTAANRAIQVDALITGTERTA